MAKKKYNIENPDAYYRNKENFSLRDFNQYYIQYLNEKQELESRKRQIRFTHHYMYDDALVNKGHFLLACYDTLTYIQEDCAATVPFTPTTYCYDKFYLEGFSVEGYNAGQTLEATLDADWQEWVNAWATANGMADKTDKYQAGGTLVDYNKMVYEFAVDQYKTLYGSEKVFKPVIPVIEPEEIPVIPEPPGLVPSFKEYDPGIIEPRVSGSLLFPGQWQKAEGWHIAYYNKLAYDVPDLFIISDASDLVYKKELLICISVYWPGVPYVLVFNRRNMVQFGQKDQWPISQWDINPNEIYGVVKQVHKNLDVWQWITTSYRNDFDFLEGRLIPPFNQPRLGRDGWAIGDSAYFFVPGDVIDLSWLNVLQEQYKYVVQMVDLLKAQQGRYKVSQYLTAKLEGQLHV